MSRSTVTPFRAPKGDRERLPDGTPRTFTRFVPRHPVDLEVEHTADDEPDETPLRLVAAGGGR